MSSSDEFDEPEGKKENDQKSESDIKSNDNFGEDDYFNNNIEEYKNAEYTPSVDPPKEITFSTRKPNDFRPARVTNETFMNFNEKFQKMKNTMKRNSPLHQPKKCVKIIRPLLTKI